MKRMLFVCLCILVISLGCVSETTNEENGVLIDAQEVASVKNIQNTEEIEEVEPVPVIEITDFCEKERLDSEDNRKFEVDILGNNVGWIYDVGVYTKIKMLNLITNKEFDVEGHDVGELSLSDDKVSYLRFDSRIININDIETGEKAFSYSGKKLGVEKTDPRLGVIWKNYFIISEKWNFNNLYYINVSDDLDQRTLIFSETYVDNLDKAVYDYVVVWRAVYDNLRTSKIFLKDLKDNSSKIVELAIGAVDNPDIYHKNVVWQENKGSDWDIFLYNIDTKETKQITPSGSNQTNPKVSLYSVVWQDDRNGNWDIYSYEFLSEKEIRLTNDSVNQIKPDVSGNIVVWIENDTAIYSCEI